MLINAMSQWLVDIFTHIAPDFEAPNARHHPRPCSRFMRGTLMGRRVHAVVRPRRLRTISQLWSAAIGPSRQHTICLCREASRQDKTQALGNTLVKG